MKIGRYPKFALLALAGACVAGCGNDNLSSGTIVLTECWLPKLPVAAQCGTLEVPENGAKPEGRRISIAVAVLRANTLNPLPDPLFLLAGGPGQAATDLGPFAAKLTGVRKSRDIVLVDQRGTGRSTALTCAAFNARAGAAPTPGTDSLARAESCAIELAARGVDVAQYTTAAWLHDLDAVRSGLGYARINLWGEAYGTRVALEYVRAYPGRVRSAILDGVVPPSVQISHELWRSGDAALVAVLDHCANTSACKARYPDLGAKLDRLYSNLGIHGQHVPLHAPETGIVRMQTIGFGQVIGALQDHTHSPELFALLPEIIDRAAAGDFAPLFASMRRLNNDHRKQLNYALYLSVSCTEEAQRGAGRSKEKAFHGLTAESMARRAPSVCAIWPKGPAIDIAMQPVHSALPMLVFSGMLDPITPPANGAEVAATLPSSRHIIAGGYGHLISSHACAPRLIAAFIDKPDFSSLPASCVKHLENSKRPGIWIGNLGGR